MKPALILFFIVLTACGSGGGGGGSGTSNACATMAISGTWEENAGAQDRYSFSASCSGTNTNCQYSYTHNAPTSDLGDIHLTVTASNNLGGCPTVGQRVDCNWTDIGGGQIQMNCGSGTLQFSKIAN
jgi:hypothetical protein